MTTRAQAKNISPESANDVRNHEVARQKDMSPDNRTIGPDAFIAEQSADPTLAPTFQKVIPESELPPIGQGYYVCNGVLMRRWASKDNTGESVSKNQIVVPKSLRPTILHIAHDATWSGHLGVKKTYARLLADYFWTTMKQDVIEWCRGCKTCQIAGKPGHRTPRAPLEPITVPNEPFQRLIVDCVGPLPRAKSGCQYLLTIMCATTRFPEAIPLKQINAKEIVRGLIKFFSWVGFPKIIQTDQGTNFTSTLFRQVLRELEVHHVKSTAYHPQSQGALERFHQTLKTMLRSYCLQHEQEWDQAVPLLLFAARSAVQESTNYSPFQMVFGHEVKGPLKLLKDALLNASNELNLLEYVRKFQERLTKTWEHARINLESAQCQMKRRYDLKATERQFQPGDKVLLRSTLSGPALTPKHLGPYTVKERLSPVN